MYLDHSTFSCILHEPEVDEKCHEKGLSFSLPKRKQLARQLWQNNKPTLAENWKDFKDFWKYLYSPNVLITEREGMKYLIKAGICIL